jgi:hypothetical protein
VALIYALTVAVLRINGRAYKAPVVLPVSKAPVVARLFLWTSLRLAHDPQAATTTKLQRKGQ